MDTVPLPVSVIVYAIQTEEGDFITVFCGLGGQGGRRRTYLSVSERKKLCCMLSWLTAVV